MRNPYTTLGLKPDADTAAIKAAYRRLAKSLHPDAQAAAGGGKASADAQARFQDVTAAYNLLKDKAARLRFDQKEAADAEMRAWSRNNATANPSSFQEEPFVRGRGARARFEPDDMGGGADMFTGLFGGLRDAGKRVFRARGEDQTFRLSVSFLDAARGGKQRVTLSGERSLDVKIPAGLEDGQQIRLRGQGGEGFGGAPAGDAIITVSVERHETMTRDGLNILQSLPVSLPEAVLGAKLEIETLTGPVSLTIPAGSNSGSKLRLKGRGIKLDNGSQAGDLIVTLALSLPDETDQTLRDFVAGWGLGLAHDPRRKTR
ncbi:MAG: DnaJ C-terminal domain-containing protein [Parvibaculaceae bacterium]